MSAGMELGATISHHTEWARSRPLGRDEMEVG